MALLDIIIAIIVLIAAIGGFVRGLVQEVLSLSAWVLAAISVHTLHPNLSIGLRGILDAEITAPILAFAVLMLIPYAAMKVIAGNVSGASDGAVLGPIDRVLGFGFGGLKGALIAIFAFSLMALGFDESWGYRGRPEWITLARTYPAADAFSRELVPLIAIRRAGLQRDAEEQERAAARAAG